MPVVIRLAMLVWHKVVVLKTMGMMVIGYGGASVGYHGGEYDNDNGQTFQNEDMFAELLI